MPIDPRISLMGQAPNIGGTVMRGAQLIQQARQQKAAGERANALLELKRQEETRTQQEQDRKNVLRDTAIEGKTLLPFVEKGDYDGLKKTLMDKSTKTKDPKMQQAWLDLLNITDQNPEQGKQALQGVINRARSEKLIPDRPTTGKPEKFTQESLREFEETGRESSLIPRDTPDKGLDRLPTIAEQFKLVGPKGQRPELGKTLRQLKDEGFKTQQRVSKRAESQIKNVDATLNTLERLALGEEQEGVREGGVFTSKAGVTSRLWDDAKKTWNRISQNTKEQALYESFANGTTSQLCRAAGEKGNLSNKDIERCVNLIPKTGEGLDLPDTREVAESKLKQLRGWFDEMLGAEQATKEGTTIINRKTGKRMIMRGGKWRPLK